MVHGSGDPVLSLFSPELDREKRWPNESSFRILALVWINPPVEPTLDELQVAIDGGLGNLHEGSGFFGGAAQKVAQFDQLSLIGIQRAQFVQSAIQVQQLRAANVHPGQVVAERNALASAAPHLGLISTRMVDQDHAHYPGRKGEEMPPVA